MGNFLGLCAFGGSNKAVLQVMKMNDGKMLEFRGPIRVRDLLVKYPNSYVGLFKEATQALPLDYKLKFGRVYYLLPCSCLSTTSETLAHRGGGHSDEIRRIKLVITRQQLEQILSNQVKVEDLIMAVKKRPCKRVSPVKTCNLQTLESIPEELEGVY